MTTKRTTRRQALRLAAAGAAALPLAKATTAAAAPNVVGVWRLVSATATDANGNKLAVPYGPRGMGIVTLTSDGRMMAVLVDGRATLPEGTKREYSSYCGNYTFDGSTLITKPDASSDPSRFTVDQVRKVRFEGDRMVLIPPVSEVKGVKVTREIFWERISTVSL
jgi:hypothetical protein